MTLRIIFKYVLIPKDEKWVDKDFLPHENKKELIEICGHYVLSDEQFLKIKPQIDSKIKETINEKLASLSNVI